MWLLSVHVQCVFSAQPKQYDQVGQSFWGAPISVHPPSFQASAPHMEGAIYKHACAQSLVSMGADNLVIAASRRCGAAELGEGVGEMLR